MTYGGYSKSMVVDQNFVLRLSDKLDLAAAAPLLCAGITTYSPLRKWKVGKGQKVGVVGLGVDELSVAPGSVPAVLSRTRTLDAAACRDLAAQALDAVTVAEVRALVRGES
jgi:D-arabinose 1-dehydrogenase-like Zn-dependent alcohol dehydrogenase